MNKVILVGRLTADPQLHQTPSGVSSCRFSIAVDRKFPDKETGERKADFINCVAFNKTAEHTAKWFTKGKMIAVEGNLRNNNYKDKNHDDVMHYTIDVMVDNVEFAGDSKTGGEAPAAQSTTAPVQNEVTSDDEVPF